MKIFGLDFTSAPKPRKPITCARCTLTDAVLQVEEIEHFTSFDAFDNFLQRPGPWVGGFDFPFGQPRRLIENMPWPNTWEGYVQHLAQMSMPAFMAQIKRYRDQQPLGDKHHLRVVDALSGAISPMMLYGIPVGKMFFRGAPRLLASGVSILPNRPTSEHRVALEAYPSLVAQIWTKQSYKSDARAKQTTERQQQRQIIVEGLLTDLVPHYQVSLSASVQLIDYLVTDASGDTLDSVLAAIQAAWAASQPEQTYGIPADADPLEGWITDPALR